MSGVAGQQIMYRNQLTVKLVKLFLKVKESILSLYNATKSTLKDVQKNEAKEGVEKEKEQKNKQKIKASHQKRIKEL